MICDSCIHKEVCYELEEDRQALKHCSDYFNFEEELEKILEKINVEILSECPNTNARTICMSIINIHIAKLKGENK